MLLAVTKILFSIYIIWKVSSSFDLAANYITRNWGDGIKGATVNAIASSLPELLISSIFLFYHQDIIGFSAGYATIIGSSAFNIAFIPVISYIFIYYKNRDRVFMIDKSIVFQDSLFLISSIIILSLGFIIGIGLYLSILLIALYCLYIYTVYSTRKKNAYKKFSDSEFLNEIKLEKENTSYINSLINLRLYNILSMNQINNFNSIIVVVFSVLLIGGSCWILVGSVEEISIYLEINLFITAFFIAAISSSIPDTILSIKDAENGKFVDSFSNTYASNIFDICIGIGLPVAIYSLFFNPIKMNIPIDRFSLFSDLFSLPAIGDYILNGNLLMWSLFILFIFTILCSLIYLSGKINFKNSILILLVYLSFIICLLSF